MSFYNTILQEAIEIFHSNGINVLSEQALIRKLNVSGATFYEFFEDKEDLLLQAITYSLAEEREEHKSILSAALNPVEEIMGLLTFGIHKLRHIAPGYFQELITQHTSGWALYNDHSNHYTIPLVADILERGKEQGLFCANLNTAIATRIILGQVKILLDQSLFPAEEFSLGEVYKAVYLNLIRGFCTLEGVKITEKFFTVSNPATIKTEVAEK